jgi:hypothetical protein
VRVINPATGVESEGVNMTEQATESRPTTFSKNMHLSIVFLFTECTDALLLRHFRAVIWELGIGCIMVVSRVAQSV